MICIIPQHGGSVRLPGKAFRNLCGKPLVAWAVIQAVAAKCIDKVYVSTESQGIADICEPLGAEIIWRPPEITDKKYSAMVPLNHAMHVIGEAALKGPTLHMLATTPLKKPGDLDRMCEAYLKTPASPQGLIKAVCMAAQTQEVTMYRRHTPVNGVDRGRLVNVDKTHNTLMTFAGANVTDAEEVLASYDRIGWAFNQDPLDATDMREGISDHDDFLIGLGSSGAGMFYYVPCDLWQTHEIDDASEFEICEVLMENFILKGRTAEEVYG